ncbi:aminopeptidase P family protein [Phocaeicola coprophilus]|nr:aminopeptidase P family protein [Phocaeicola coprophilus]
MKESITERIGRLRQCLREQSLSAFIIPSTDPHSGEYVPDHWKTREWVSGFTGSAGTAVITLDDAALWTDSRYFLQAADQLDGTGIRLMKDRLPDTPSIPEWLGQSLSPGAVVGVDGWVNTIGETQALREALAREGLTLRTDYDPVTRLWDDRPALPGTPVSIHPLEYAGVACHKKLAAIREKLLARGADGILLSTLDDIAWTLNLRGNDVHCNPVFVSYLLITSQESILYVRAEKLTTEVKAYLAQEGVNTEDYDDLQEDLRDYPYATLSLDPGRTNEAVRQAVNPLTKVLLEESPVPLMKAVKNEAEIRGFHAAMLRDGVAMVKFLKWLEEAVPQGNETEMSIDRKLYECRAEQPLFRGISFDTIAGYKEHAAIVHYEATPETDKPLAPEGLLLLDSGAQYADGTTDITRTIALGETTDDERRDYTLVLKGHIGLTRACFPQGTCGTQLDVLARQAMWREGANFLHGTGHGVGAYLNVHEGPHQIRMNHVPTPLRPGMTVTDEPGIYRAGRYGIRTENTLLVVPYRETEFGTFYTFEPLTLCPIDTRPIVRSMLTAEETEWLNAYHRMVYDRLSPLLDEEHRAWLESKTKQLIINN